MSVLNLRPAHNSRSFRLAVNAALGLLYAGALVLVFGALGYVAEATELQHRLADAQLAAVRLRAYNEGVAAGQADLMAAADAAWQAADRVQQYAAEQAALAHHQLGQLQAAAQAGGCTLPAAVPAEMLAAAGGRP